MTPRRTLITTLLLLGLVACSAFAQEPILSFSTEPQTVAVPAGGVVSVRVTIRNDSIREADDIALGWVGPETIALAEDVGTIKVLAPFSSIDIVVSLAADEAAEVSLEGLLEVVYTYCIGDLCFQVVDDIPILLLVEPAAVVAPLQDNGSSAEVNGPLVDEADSSLPAGPVRIPWSWILPVVGILLLVGAYLLYRVRGDMWPLYVAMMILIGGSLVYGVSQRQHEQAKSIGSVLCLSCVGIEVANDADPSFTPAGMARIEAIDREIELWVFFAIWCKTCPFAEAMVELAASYNPNLTYRFVDVEREPELAVKHGVVETGRTVVPAILRVDTGELIFGAERLDTRLVDLLEADE